MHTSKNRIVQMKEKNMVYGLEKMDKPPRGTPLKLCEPCLQGKQHRRPISKKPQPGKHDDIPVGAYCAMDIMVFNRRSKRGYKYYIHAVDVGSRKQHGKEMKHKNDAPAFIKEYEAMVAARFPHLVSAPHVSAIRILKTDGESCLMSNGFQEYCKQRGILHSPTTAYTPEHNGMAERAGKSLGEATRAALYQARLPVTMWPEALNAMTYTSGYLPHKVVSTETTCGAS